MLFLSFLNHYINYNIKKKKIKLIKVKQYKDYIYSVDKSKLNFVEGWSHKKIHITNTFNLYFDNIGNIDIFENHTTNGGFEEFFWNSSGQFSHEILAAYEAIGATKTATLIYNAFKEFGEIPIPKDHAFRKKILTELNSNAWDTLDQAFYKSKEAIVPLVLLFVAKNSAYFD